MYFLSDKLHYQGEKEEISFISGEKQIIFTQLDNVVITQWLQEEGFPETFIEDIHNEDQSVTYEQNKKFKLIILKYFMQEQEDEFLYNDENVAIIITADKFIFLSRDSHIVNNVVSHLYKRYEEDDSLEYIMYTVLDIIVDHTMSIVDKLEDKLEAIEDQIFSENVDEKEIQTHLYFARRTLNRIAKLSVQVNDAVNKAYNHFPTALREKLKYEFIGV